MFGVARRFGLSRALQVSAPRALSTGTRWTPQLSKFQSPLARSTFPSRSFQTSFPALSQAAEAVAQDIPVAASEYITEFHQLAERELISPNVVRNITERMGLSTMTPVQSQTLNIMLKGEDVLAHAKTGTGKTLAFLLPTVQNILNDPKIQEDISNSNRLRDRKLRSSSADIRALIISPTRELAEQIAKEAEKVVYGTGLRVQTAVGGTAKREGLRRIQREGCHLLIGTPSRLKDILSDPYSGVTAPNLNTLIFDEADRLLDQGFADEISEIESLLPDPSKVDRQSLMFSATIPKEVINMVERTMKPDYQYVKTVRDDEVPTHMTVPQNLVYLRGYENALPAVFDLARQYQARQAADSNLRPFKAILYLNATLDVQLAYQAFRALPRQNFNGEPPQRPLGRLRMFDIHSRLSQAQRTWSSDSFRKAEEAILFSSDVTARGMDFPDVTHVIQLGIPRDRETYIHRLGRTARANKSGEGWLLIHRGEMDAFEEKLYDLPLNENTGAIPAATFDMTNAGDGPVPEAVSSLKAAMELVPQNVKEDAYRAQLGASLSNFYSKKIGIKVLNNQAIHGWGMETPPTISHKTATSAGLTRVPGVNIGHVERPRREDKFGGGRSGGDRFGGDKFGDRSFRRSDRRSRDDHDGSSFGFRPSNFSGRERSDGPPRRRFMESTTRTSPPGRRRVDDWDF
ncbi:ATP-dependent RNA helicase [Penicillium chermesinum]|uniref:ATP-dependent RNA helicase n=1 Tax=Penicillium chermesinum TaxID=63820 RepID=A0A9W9NWP0_9EURO|nr:ATP-dependent RNA helicase [Penicillium chermesinum]KAJ5226328.1 ATP-dependent RNA helicase [Penicillium chermesinum]